MILRALAALVLVLLVPAVAWGAPPELRTSIDADTIGVGDDVHLSLQAMSQDDQPTEPRPGATTGFVLHGTSIMPSTQIFITNGVRVDKRGINATWTLRAQRPGTFTVGPPSVQVGGKRVSGQPVKIRVLPQGQTAPRRGGGAVSPFDPWKGLFGLDFDEEPAPAREPEVHADPRLSLDAARAPGVFLHATVDKTRAVVGEQVTLSILMYVEATEREPDFNDVHEATVGDFLKKTLLENEQARYLGIGLAGGRLWNVKLIRKWALFPLKAGNLDIGPMTIAREQSNLHRESEALKVAIADPPLAGRPPGYAVGDVGRFDLSTEVTPQNVVRGDAVGVNVELKGTGNLPAQLTPPARAGVEWLAPEIHEKIGTVKGSDRLGGSRTFSYVVRLQREGDVDLGELTLPYYDPDARAYGVARAQLGVVHVAPGAAPAPPDAQTEILPGLPEARPALAPPRRPGRHLTDAPLYWLGLGATPLAWVAFAGVRGAARRLRARSSDRKADPGAEMKGRIAEADAASKGGDARAADGATARALEASAIACVGVNLRGTTGDRAREELEKAGLDEAAARDVVALYGACDAARFSPEASLTTDAKARWAKARKLIKSLEHSPRGARS